MTSSSRPAPDNSFKPKPLRGWPDSGVRPHSQVQEEAWNIFRGSLLIIAGLILVACTGNSPGPLEGTWQVTDPIPVTVSFRSGETEAMGMIKKVSYKIDGDEVFVTYKEGPTKGASFRYTVIDTNTIRSESGTFHRVR